MCIRQLYLGQSNWSRTATLYRHISYWSNIRFSLREEGLVWSLHTFGASSFIWATQENEAAYDRYLHNLLRCFYAQNSPYSDDVLKKHSAN
jgi:hypothetical protein